MKSTGHVHTETEVEGDKRKSGKEASSVNRWQIERLEPKQGPDGKRTDVEQEKEGHEKKVNMKPKRGLGNPYDSKTRWKDRKSLSSGSQAC
jgi:hypothetical protein